MWVGTLGLKNICIAIKHLHFKLSWRFWCKMAEESSAACNHLPWAVSISHSQRKSWICLVRRAVGRGASYFWNGASRVGVRNRALSWATESLGSLLLWVTWAILNDETTGTPKRRTNLTSCRDQSLTALRWPATRACTHVWLRFVVFGQSSFLSLSPTVAPPLPLGIDSLSQTRCEVPPHPLCLSSCFLVV